jgi:hypothetical protein
MVDCYMVVKDSLEQVSCHYACLHHVYQHECQACEDLAPSGILPFISLQAFKETQIQEENQPLEFGVHVITCWGFKETQLQEFKIPVITCW